MAIPYVKQAWVDNNVANPVSAARLGVIESGIFDAHYMPAVRVTHNVAQTLTTAVSTLLAFNTERFDQASNTADTMHDTVTNNSRLICRYAGVYLIIANVEWAGNTAGARTLTIRHSAGVNIASGDVTPVVAVNYRQSVATIYAMAVNEYVEVQATQTSGGNLNVLSTGNYSPEFMMCRVA